MKQRKQNKQDNDKRWRNEKKKKNKKKKNELKSSKHRSLHVFDWTLHRTRKLNQTNLIDWQSRDSFVDDRLQIIERVLDEAIWRNFLIFDDKISDWIFFSQELKKRKVDVIIWSRTHEKFMNLLCNERMMMIVLFKTFFD